MRDHRVETRAALLEWAPELLLLITDLLIPMAMGLGGEVGGVSVAGLVMGALGRLCQAFWAVVATQGAKRDGQDRAAVMGQLWWAAGVAAALALPAWATRDLVEAWTGLPGYASYMQYGALYWLVIRVSIVGYVALGVSQAHMGQRVVLSWATCSANAALTWWLVPTMGVAGSSLATLIVTVPATLYVVGTAVRSGLVGRPTISGLRGIWPMVAKRLQGDAFSLLGSATALSLNSWLGAEGSKTWSLMHLACDVAGGAGLVAWGVCGKHLTYFSYGVGGDPVRGEAAWRWGDRVAIAIQVAGAIVALAIVPWGAAVVFGYALNKRAQTRCAAAGTVEAEGRVRASKMTYTAVTMAGYIVIMATVTDPGVALPACVYCVATAVAARMCTRR